MRKIDKFFHYNISKLKMPANAVDTANKFSFDASSYWQTAFTSPIDGAFVKITKDSFSESVLSIEVRFDPTICNLGNYGRNPLYTFFGVLGAVQNHEDWINNSLEAFADLKDTESYYLMSDSLIFSIDCVIDHCRISAHTKKISDLA